MNDRWIAFLRFFMLSLFFANTFKSTAALADTALVSDESRLTLDATHFSIKAPRGWRIRADYRGKSLLFEDTSGKPAKPGTVHFVPNVTVALMRQPHFIDQIEVGKLEARILKEFSTAPGVSEMQILESRFVDHRGKADGILVYTALRYNGEPLNQMHLLLSGREESALLTYTQLEEAFAFDTNLKDVWQSMLSSEFRGFAPKRYEGLLLLGGGLGILSLFLCYWHWRRKLGQQRMMRRAEYRMETDDSVYSPLQTRVLNELSRTFPTPRPFPSTQLLQG